MFWIRARNRRTGAGGGVQTVLFYPWGQTWYMSPGFFVQGPYAGLPDGDPNPEIGIRTPSITHHPHGPVGAGNPALYNKRPGRALHDDDSGARSICLPSVGAV